MVMCMVLISTQSPFQYSTKYTFLHHDFTVANDQILIACHILIRTALCRLSNIAHFSASMDFQRFWHLQNKLRKLFVITKLHILSRLLSNHIYYVQESCSMNTVYSVSKSSKGKHLRRCRRNPLILYHHSIRTIVKVRDTFVSNQEFNY